MSTIGAGNGLVYLLDPSPEHGAEHRAGTLCLLNSSISTWADDRLGQG